MHFNGNIINYKIIINFCITVTVYKQMVIIFFAAESASDIYFTNKKE